MLPQGQNLSFLLSYFGYRASFWILWLVSEGQKKKREGNTNTNG